MVRREKSNTGTMLTLSSPVLGLSSPALRPERGSPWRESGETAEEELGQHHGTLKREKANEALTPAILVSRRPGDGNPSRPERGKRRRGGGEEEG